MEGQTLACPPPHLQQLCEELSCAILLDMLSTEVGSKLLPAIQGLQRKCPATRT